MGCKLTPKLTILITGANGSIGCDLVEKLSLNYKVLALYRTENFFSNNFNSKNVTWIKQDLKKKIECEITPDVIIHGAVTHPFASRRSNVDYIDSNIISLLNTIDFANKKKVKKFIYLSSVVIYGKIVGKILTDDNFFNNPDLLGATKILSESLLQNQNFKFLSIRLPGVLCYNNSSNERPWLNLIINKIKLSEDVSVHNEHSHFNNIIDTKEIINFLEHVLLNNFESNYSFNFAASHPLIIKDMLLFIKNFFSSASNIEFQNKITTNFTISNNILMQKLNYKPSSSMDILTRYLKSIK